MPYGLPHIHFSLDHVLGNSNKSPSTGVGPVVPQPLPSLPAPMTKPSFDTHPIVKPVMLGQGGAGQMPSDYKQVVDEKLLSEHKRPDEKQLVLKGIEKVADKVASLPTMTKEGLVSGFDLAKNKVEYIKKHKDIINNLPMDHKKHVLLSIKNRLSKYVE